MIMSAAATHRTQERSFGVSKLRNVVARKDESGRKRVVDGLLRQKQKQTNREGAMRALEVKAERDRNSIETGQTPCNPSIIFIHPVLQDLML
jgi:hypothetical protein